MEKDFNRITSNIPCKYRSYELKSIERLIAVISCCGKFIEENPILAGEKEIFASVIVPKLSKLQLKGEQLKENLRNMIQKEAFISDFGIIHERSKELLDFLSELDVVNRKPRQVDLTDAGPGVAVSNFEVKFRDAEIACLHKSDYRIRVHRSRGDSGELFFEYLKHSCSDVQTQLCEYCLQTEWTGPYMQRIPQPIPDLNRPGHFKDVWDTSFLQEDGTSRVRDDWQPRANIIKRFKDGLLNNAEAVTNFAKEFCVNEIHVQAYVTHIVNLKNAQNIRSNDRKLQNVRKIRKQYKDYDWEKLVLDRNLNRLLVHELQTQTVKNREKSDKVKLVTRHVLSNSEKGHNQRVVSDDEAENSGEDVEEVCSDEDEKEESEDEIEESEEEILYWPR
ncbi:unnamed protein product [Mytilus coruscus]|uniref:Uncharacterized protein n=1 Tax=Mytilus coruscus TaxID=42192 RepID=A0A6J8EB34_MYTCO|nr:unnamed protein product [Mytilus coruscus]